MTRPPRAAAGADAVAKGLVGRDPQDVRDLIYRPSLGLLPERFLCAALDPAQKDYAGIFRLRDQKKTPTCVGQALAALIDIQRIESYRQQGDPAGARQNVQPSSADMLYAMALEIERHEAGQTVQEVFSLRSGLKGFYNSGVCSEATWNQRPLARKGQFFDSTSVAVSVEARKLTLGAYYRVRSFINDMHTALVEAGALYVSAQVHDGWQALSDGVIGAAGETTYGHAFAIVGYDANGFLVLNSWGGGWGGYRFAGGPPLPGIALWPYTDWAANVLDAWALRLAAPTPDAFRFAIGQHGSAMFGADQPALGAPSVRRLEVLGHYLHLDDGRHVTTGAYPSSRRCLETTLEYLETKKKRDEVRHIRLTLHGDTRRLEEVMWRLASEIAADKAQGFHAISLVWANGLISGAAEALKPLFEHAAAIANGNKDDADARIEKMTRPVGRALWRDVRRQAQIAARQTGDATHALTALVELCLKTDRRLHLQTEGAGVLLLVALLAGPFKSGRLRDDLGRVLDQLTLVAPLVRPQEFDDHIGSFLEGWPGRATIFRPDATFDERLSVGAYSRSWTDLVARAFEEEPVKLVGAHDFDGTPRGDPLPRTLTAPDRPSGDLTSNAILLHEVVRQNALKTT